MKTKILFSTFLLGAFHLFAQSGEVTNAKLALQEGALGDAKTSIDKATEHEKTKNEPKTWLTRGEVYQAIAGDPKYGKETPDAAKTAFESFKKARQLDETAVKPNKYKKDIDKALAAPALPIVVQNGGIVAFQNKDYKGAYSYFTMLQEIKPQDTLGYTYAAQMAISGEDYKSAKETYVRLIEKTGYVTKEVLNNQIYIYKNVESEKDYNKALEVAKMGRAKYPTDQNFIAQEIDLLKKTGKLPEAIASAEATAQKDPKPENYLLLGSLYEENKELDKARDAYNKVLSLNPNSFEANFNLGALMFNPAVEIMKKVRDMGVSDYQKKGKSMESQAKEILKLALPYFEKANQIKPSDEGTKKTLKEIYNTLGETEKAKAIK